MTLSTAALSAHSCLHPDSQIRSNWLPFLALYALATIPGQHTVLASSGLSSAFVPEAALYKLKPSTRPAHYVTADESRILRLAILASSEIINKGVFSDT